MEPGPGLGAEAERAVAEVEIGVGRFDADGRRQDLVEERERGIDEPGQPRGALGMADRRLDRAHDAIARGSAGVLEESAERLDLDDVAQGGAGAVRLDVADGAGRDAGLVVGALESAHLAFDDRGGQAARPAVA